MMAPSPEPKLRALITGASSGLGRSLAIAMAQNGVAVHLVARRSERLDSIVQGIRESGGSALAFPLDLRRVQEIRRLGSAITRASGGIDILVNNAGSYGTPGAIVSTRLSNWSDVVNLNLRAPFLLMQTFVPGMIKRRIGTVVNIISATKDCVKIAPYRISKVGLEVLTAASGEELRKAGVRVFAFNPSWMRTEMSSGGQDPEHAAAALTELIRRADKSFCGEFFDLEWCGQQFSVTKRAREAGRYGG